MTPRVVEHALLCTGCEYDLRGSNVTGDCPECGRPIVRSLQGNLVRTADPRWIARLALGTRWVFIGILVVSTTAMLAVWTPMLDLVPVPLQFPIHILSLLPLVSGLWMLTDPEPGVTSRSWRDRLTPRLVTRLVVAPVATLWPMVLWHVSRPPTWFIALEALADLLRLVAIVALSMHAQRIALRLPDVRLARQTSWCLLGAVAAFLVSALFRPPWHDLLVNHLPVISLRTRHPQLAWIGFRVGVELLLSLIAFFACWSLALLVWYRNRLRWAARDALSALSDGDPGRRLSP